MNILKVPFDKLYTNTTGVNEYKLALPGNFYFVRYANFMQLWHNNERIYYYSRQDTYLFFRPKNKGCVYTGMKLLYQKTKLYDCIK